MNTSEVRRRTMGNPPPTVGVRFERMDFDEVRARDLDMYEKENAELYREGKAGYYLVRRLCDVCPCCGPTPRDESIFFLVGDVPVDDVPLEDIEDPEVDEWVADQIVFDRNTAQQGLDLLERPGRPNFLSDDGISLADVTVLD